MLKEELKVEASRYPEELGQEEKQPNLVVNLRGQSKYTILVESCLPQSRTELEFVHGKLTGIKKTETVPVPK